MTDTDRPVVRRSFRAFPSSVMFDFLLSVMLNYSTFQTKLSMLHIVLLYRKLNNCGMMNTIHDTYRARLRLLADEAGSQAKLAELINRSPAQISQWLSTSASARQLSPASARHIEQVLGKPAGWMDQPLDAFRSDTAASLPELRRRHLYELFTQAGGYGPLSQRVGISPLHLMSFVEGGREMDGETARRIESALAQPAGQMDTFISAPTSNWRPLPDSGGRLVPPPAPSVSDDERALLVAWRNAKRATQQAVRLVLLPSRDGLDNEISLALRLLELAAPAILNNNCQQPAPA